MKKYSKFKENNFTQLLWNCGFTDISPKSKPIIAKYLSVSVRSLERYIKSNSAPQRIYDILELKRLNMNKCDSWNGFSFNGDKLITPNGYEYKANELLNLKGAIAAFEGLKNNIYPR